MRELDTFPFESLRSGRLARREKEMPSPSPKRTLRIILFFRVSAYNSSSFIPSEGLSSGYQGSITWPMKRFVSVGLCRTTKRKGRSITTS